MNAVPQIRRFIARLRVEGALQVVIDAETEEEAREIAGSTRILKNGDVISELPLKALLSCTLIS